MTKKDFINRVMKIYDDESQAEDLFEEIYGSCNGCIHKIDETYQEECMSCKRYYADNFEKKNKW